MKAQKIPILPIRNTIIFPGVVFSITVGRQSSQKLILDAKRRGTLIGIIGQRDPSVEEPSQEDLFPMGTVAKVLEIARDEEEDKLNAKVHGIYRFELLQIVQKSPYLKAEIREVSELSDKVNTPSIKNLLAKLKENFIQIIEQNEAIPRSVLNTVKKNDNPSYLADLAATYLELSIDEKEEILETINISARLNLILKHFQRELQKLKVNEEVKKELNRLAEKFASIAEGEKREEKREDDLTSFLESLVQDDDDELRELEEKINSAGMPDSVRMEALKELKRLSRTPLQSAEYNVTRTYLEYLIELPWNKISREKFDLQRAREILDADHYGLKKAKNRILEYLAVSSLRGDLKAPILCFVGPPGVGKTSLGRSIAKALGRKYHRISLGGVRDEAEIRGHRRTYVGAMPGRIIQALRKVQTKNPVIVLDEIDKLGSDIVRGDPSSALLEALDPEQNKEFSDHYIGHPFDLSKTMFIATANTLNTIPPALRDRLEVIEISGYTEEEKVEIAKNYLLPKQLRENGLPPQSVKISKQTLIYICRNYTNEAGVRGLERVLGNICRALAVKIVTASPSEEDAPPPPQSRSSLASGISNSSGGKVEDHSQRDSSDAHRERDSLRKLLEKPRLSASKIQPVTITKEKVIELLGPPKYPRQNRVKISSPGISIALAWTPYGGELLSIETAKMKGSGKLLLTGQLGEVMKESAQACLSYLKSYAKQLKIRTESFENCDIHIHIPAGAVPKEGPSAGIALLISLYSLFTNRKVRSDIAMTGEISLHGNVLPVGGIKEKLLAAHRMGIREVIIPADNQPDLSELPPYLEKKLKIHKIKSALEAIPIVFKKKSQKKVRGKSYTERKKQ